MIKASNLTIAYGRKTILEDISFTATKGELIGIIGPNGIGKSTFLKALRGFIPLAKGSITIAKQNLADLSEQSLAKIIAYQGQNINSNFNYTAYDVVLAARYAHLKWYERPSEIDREKVLQAMHYTKCFDYKDMPLNQLSGGQRERVFLAKTIAQDTPLLFFDEPCVGLDIFHQDNFLKEAVKLAKSGKTILMVIHELALAARFCTRLCLLTKGRILADGLAADVLTKANLSLAYNAPLEVTVNAATGHYDIYSAESQ